MSFLDTVARAKTYLREHGRVSLRGLKREFELDDEALGELVEELVEVQQVASREGKVLSWVAPKPSAKPAGARSPAVAQAAEGEHRQLTVMFCDLVGSTELSQRLDAEDLRNVVRAYQNATSGAIARYGGHVAQYLGDGLLVYFGYPQAHEENAERAVRAGLEILIALGALNETLETEHGIRLAARIGIHTGPVVIGEMGGGDRVETLALGDTTNIAARLENVAGPDSVVISEATLRLVPGVFLIKDLGTPALRGITEPVRAYAVLQTSGARSRLDLDPSKLTPLVGRERELGLLFERWEQVKEGAGQAVLVSGEAGLGKSRLLQAFRARLAEESHAWLECRCTPYTQHSAFFPLIELVEQGLGFKPGDDPEAKLRRLEAGIELAGLSVAEDVPGIAPLLLLPLPHRYPPRQESPELRRTKTIEAIVAWVLALAERQPLVVLFEDLHWCDPSTVELLGRQLEQSPKSKVLTLLSFRPEFEPPWPARSHVTHLDIGRLRARQAADLVGGVTRDLPLPEEVVTRIVGRADGVPLFLEELTKMVLESGLVAEREGRYALTGHHTELAIPTTLQDSLMARLDRLSAGRDVAQRTAVLGREFSYTLAAASVGLDEGALREGLARLVEVDLLFQRGEPPHATYQFKHALLQEAAYVSLLRSTRQQLHGRIVEVLLERFSEQAAAAPELVARHAEAAGRTEKAIEYYRRAGSLAQERSANEEAAGHFRKAIALLETSVDHKDDRLELSLQLALGASLTAVRGYTHPDRRAAFERARVLGETIGDPSLLGHALIGVSISECISGAMEHARSLATRVLAAAEENGDSELALHAHSQIAQPEYFQGRFASSLEHCERALAIYDPPRHHGTAYLIGGDSGFAALGVSAWNLWHLGHPDRALARAREAARLAKRFEYKFGLGFSAFIEGIVHWLRRDFAAQERIAASQIAVGEAYGFPVWLGLGKAIHGAARVGLGDAGAVSEVLEGLALAAQTGTRSGSPKLLAMLAATRAAAGSFEEARGAVEMGLAVAAETDQRFQDAELERMKGELILQDEGEPAVTRQQLADGCFRKSVEIARSQGARSLELRALTSFAPVLVSQGRAHEARTLLELSYRGFTEGFGTADLRKARSVLADLA